AARTASEVTWRRRGRAPSLSRPRIGVLGAHPSGAGPRAPSLGREDHDRRTRRAASTSTPAAAARCRPPAAHDSWGARTASRSLEGGGGRARVVTAVSRREDLGLLRLELGIREDALRLEVRQVLQLRDGVRGGGRRLLVLRRRVLLLRVLLLVLLRPTIRLPAGDPIRDGGCRSRDDCRPGDTA